MAVMVLDGQSWGSCWISAAPGLQCADDKWKVTQVKISDVLLSAAVCLFLYLHIHM